MMKRRPDINLVRFYLYAGLGFWVLYSFGEFAGYESETVFRRIANSIFLLSYLTVLNYFFFEEILRLFRWPCRTRLKAVFFLLIAILGYTVGLAGWRQLWIGLGVYKNYTPDLYFWKGVLVHAQFGMVYLVYFSILRNVYNNIRLREKNSQLRMEKKEAELNYLKAQTNPHFLFNTLNNIYALARDKSDLAPESILKLAKILRFVLYETGGKAIAMEEELKIITDYIALEKLRYDDSLLVTLHVDLENPKQSIPPLLLVPLVENAFKHGVSETRNKPFIDIRLSVQQQRLLFIVRNSMEEVVSIQDSKENIGLSNLRRQLTLLYKEYDFAVVQENAVFTSTLAINLASNA